jgi:hypothetical protein
LLILAALADTFYSLGYPRARSYFDTLSAALGALVTDFVLGTLIVFLTGIPALVFSDSLIGTTTDCAFFMFPTWSGTSSSCLGLVLLLDDLVFFSLTLFSSSTIGASSFF